jgi:hypothetical protein
MRSRGRPATRQRPAPNNAPTARAGARYASSEAGGRGLAAKANSARF